MMVKNYYFLIVGILCILFAVTHTMNGVANSLSILNNTAMGDDTKTAFTYVWHIIGVENLVFGIALLVMAFQSNLMKVKFTVWLIITILAIRWVVITGFTLWNSNENFMQILPDTAAIFIVILLLWFGTRVKDKISS